MGTKVSGLGVELDFGKHVSQSAPHAHRTARFFHIKGAFINASTGVPDAGKPIKLDAAGKIDSSMMNGGGGNHNLLSATHPDSVVGSPVRGDLIVGNATPKWEKLAVGVTGKFIRSNGSDALWASIAWGDVSKVGSNLTDLATRQHAGLTNVTSDQHHPQSHTLASHSTKPHSALSDVTSGQHHAQLHGSSHHSGGGDAILLDDLASPDDNTDLNASTSKHGLLLKLGGGTVNYLRADGTWTAPTPGAHASAHEVGGGDLLDFTNITGFGNYLDQAVKIASSPTFANLLLATNGYIKGVTSKTYGGLDIRADKGSYCGLNFFTNAGVYESTLMVDENGATGFYKEGIGWKWYWGAGYPGTLVTGYVPWANVSSKPGTYPPSAHSHTHASTTGRTANDHHAQAHSHTHASTTGRTANDHHAQVHALTSHSDFSTYLNQALLTTSSPTFNLLTLSGTGRGIRFSGSMSITGLVSGNNLSLEGGGGTADIQSITIASRTTTSAGNVQIASGSPYRIHRYTSSVKYKDKIKDLELDSSLIYNLQPRSFNSKCDTDNKKRRFVGLIAEEVEPIYPGIIEYGDNKEVTGYDTQMLMTLMLAETQRHEARIAALEAQLNN